MSECDKKCPKCGGEANIHVFRVLKKEKEFRVFCEACGFRTTPHFEKEDAQIEWCELCECKERMTGEERCSDFKATSDVVEVRHGEWEILLTAIIDTIGKCTNCGGEAVWRTRLKPYTRCPHCGAKMDGGDGE